MKNYQQTPRQRKQFHQSKIADKVAYKAAIPQIVKSRRMYNTGYEMGGFGICTGATYYFSGTTHWNTL